MLSTKDIGILICTRLEGKSAYAHDWDAARQRIIETEDVDHVDVSDANNPVIHLSNGQKFKIVILAI